MNKERVQLFLKNSIFQLKNQLPSGFYSWRDVEIHNHSIKLSTRPPILANIHFEFLPLLKEFSDFNKELESDPDYINCKEEIIKNTNIKWDFLIPTFISKKLFADYLWEISSLDYYVDIANIISDNFIDFLNNKETTFIYLSILKGLKTDFDQEELFNNIKIKQLTDTDVSNLIKGKYRFKIDDEIFQNRVILEKSIKYKYGIPDGDAFEKINIEFNKIISSLRLLKNDAIGRLSTYSMIYQPGKLGYDNLISSGYSYNTIPPFCKYSLKKKSLPRLIEIYESIDLITKYKNYQLSLSRYESAKIKWIPEDKILDYVIALESIFSEGSDNVRYKIGMRTACFLGSNYGFKKKVVKLIKDAYDIRSNIAHGSIKKTKTYDANKISNDLSNLFRKCFFKFINIVKTGKKLPNCEDFDNLLLQ